MTPLEIKIELMKLGVTQTQLAEENGWWREAVTMCISGARIYPEIRRAIAARLGKRVKAVFGSHHPQAAKTNQRRTAA